MKTVSCSLRRCLCTDSAVCPDQTTDPVEYPMTEEALRQFHQSVVQSFAAWLKNQDLS